LHVLFIVKEIDNEPQGILLISSVLKQAGHQVSLVVSTEENPVEAALRLLEISDLRPPVLVDLELPGR